MKLLKQMIRELYKADAKHRKGFPIREATPLLAASNAVEELGELMVAIILGNKEGIKEEMADVTAAITHLQMMVEGDGQMPFGLAGDHHLELLEDRAIEKVNKRFR